VSPGGSTPEERLADLGLAVPEVVRPVAAYLPAVRYSHFVMLAFVASTPDFTGQPAVANGASELLGEVFGDAGRHARSAVGVPVLPLDAPVEVELVVEV
jgi:hypothetical protein